MFTCEYEPIALGCDLSGATHDSQRVGRIESFVVLIPLGPTVTGVANCLGLSHPRSSKGFLGSAGFLGSRTPDPICRFRLVLPLGYNRWGGKSLRGETIGWREPASWYSFCG